ncbi:hypothetical protein GQ600_7031 [Phytophthora cactorum]|nr:hypothetical protein GQ600_7031 [Phytophthora cactorum]
MDVFRTSKLCSQCHQTLLSVRYSVNTKLPIRKKRKGWCWFVTESKCSSKRRNDMEYCVVTTRMQCALLGWRRERGHQHG